MANSREDDIVGACGDDKVDMDSAKDNSETATKKYPTCIVVLGMAGSGKTTFVQVHIPAISCYIIDIPVTRVNTRTFVVQLFPMSFD